MTHWVLPQYFCSPITLRNSWNDLFKRYGTWIYQTLICNKTWFRLFYFNCDFLWSKRELELKSVGFFIPPCRKPLYLGQPYHHLQQGKTWFRLVQMWAWYFKWSCLLPWDATFWVISYMPEDGRHKCQFINERTKTTQLIYNGDMTNWGTLS